MRAALVGNYGVGNLGDEALRDSFLQAFPEVEWHVLSAHPTQHEYARLPAGLSSFFRFDWLRTLRMFRSVDAVVFGGGSLFTDVESPFACFLWWVQAMGARLVGTPIVLACQGMGPYKTRRGEWFARSVVRKAAYISVRDEESAKRIELWSKSTKVVQTFDPVFSSMVSKKVKNSAKNVFVIIPRKNSSATFLENVYKEIESMNWEEVRVVLMEGDHEDERKIAHDIVSKVGPGIGTVIHVRTLDELMKSVSDARLVTSQRFHGALASIAAGIPTKVYPQGAGDKLSIAASIAADPKIYNQLLTLNRQGEDALKAWLQSRKKA